MTLREEFEKQKNIKAVVDEINDEYGSMYVYDPKYIEWLESKIISLQETQSNYDSPECKESYDGKHHYQYIPVCTHCGYKL